MFETVHLSKREILMYERDRVVPRPTTTICTG
jgi:hypothetical protein